MYLYVNAEDGCGVDDTHLCSTPQK